MRNAIAFPEELKKPKAPLNENYKDRIKFEEAQNKYEKENEKYKVDLENYKISLKLKPNSTFHHLFVADKEGSKKPDFENLKKYLEADVTNKEKQEFYKIELENKNKITKD